MPWSVLISTLWFLNSVLIDIHFDVFFWQKAPENCHDLRFCCHISSLILMPFLGTVIFFCFVFFQALLWCPLWSDHAIFAFFFFLRFNVPSSGLVHKCMSCLYFGGDFKPQCFDLNHPVGLEGAVIKVGAPLNACGLHDNQRNHVCWWDLISFFFLTHTQF